MAHNVFEDNNEFEYEGTYNTYLVNMDDGTFISTDNPKCNIEFFLDYSTDDSDEPPKVEIQIFECFPPTNLTIPRSSGTGRKMLFDFLTLMKERYPGIITAYLEAEAYPDMSLSKRQKTDYNKNIIEHQKKLESYYNSLGFYSEDGDEYFTGNIDHIIDSIQNYDIMKDFNYDNLNIYVERKLLHDFDIPVHNQNVIEQVDVGEKRGREGGTNKRKRKTNSNKKKTNKRKRKTNKRKKRTITNKRKK